MNLGIEKYERTPTIYDRKIVLDSVCITQKQLKLLNFLLKINPEVQLEVIGWTTIVLQDTIYATR